MKIKLVLSAGFIAGVLASLLLVSAGFPAGLVSLVLWMGGGVFGLSLLQFAFLKSTIEGALHQVHLRPGRAFLLGLLLLELPFWVASVCYLRDLPELAVLAVILPYLIMALVFWPGSLSCWLGRRLVPGQEGPSQVLAGSSVLSGTLLVPVFGWLWLLILATMTLGGLAMRGYHGRA